MIDGTSRDRVPDVFRGSRQAQAGVPVPQNQVIPALNHSLDDVGREEITRGDAAVPRLTVAT